MKNSKYWLALFDDNWADEMDVRGFSTFTDRGKEEFIDAFSKCDHMIKFCIGTNESIEYKNGEDLLKNIKWKFISAEEYIFIDEIFCGEYGFFPDIYLSGVDNEEEENEE